MEAFYSSDEEIAWGPVTLREIKSDLKRAVVRKPNRRHTVLCNIQNEKMDQSLSDEVNKLNISGTSTAYFTPNESLKTNNSEFLEKISHVINVPSSELSEYASVMEDTSHSNQSEKSENQNEPIIPHYFVTETDCNDSSAAFKSAVENRETYYDIEKFQQTLVESSFMLPKECEISHDVDNNRKDDIEEELMEEVIVLSDDSNSCITNDDMEDIDISERMKAFKKEINFDENESFEKSETESDLDEYNSGSAADVDSYESKNEFNADSDIANCDENYKQENEDNFLITPDIKQKLSTIKESLSTSPVIVPEIDLTQFDDSISKDDSLQLNDTLEEMNRFLCQGSNYSMPDDEIIDNTPAKNLEVPQQIHTPSNTYTLTKQQLFSGEKKKASQIPTRNLAATSAEKRKINIYTPNKESSNTCFKVPETPFRSKLLNPTPPKSCPPKLRNIVSPVALYIKNSPQIPLIQNVPARKQLIPITPHFKSANKENFVEFPEVIYKPSKKHIVSNEKHIIVPPYLRKLKIVESQITKHEGRINHELNMSKVSKTLLQTDITSSAIDQSLLDNTADISVLTNKQAFIK